MLLSVLLFNWVGYRLFTAFCEEREASSLESALENDNYDSSLLVTLRIPADALPYCNGSRDFQPADGFIEIGNLRYREVKKRVFNDSVEFVCIIDGAVSRLRSAGNDFFSLVNDLRAHGHGKFPGPTGKTGHNLGKTLYCSSHYFPDLHYFAVRSAWASPLPETGLPAGHARIGLQPPRRTMYSS